MYHVYGNVQKLYLLTFQMLLFKVFFSCFHFFDFILSAFDRLYSHLHFTGLMLEVNTVE